MPRKYPNYPYIEPLTCGKTDDQILAIVDKLLVQNPQLSLQDGGPLDSLCRALEVDVEYSDLPNDILLDVPADRNAVIFLAKNSKTRHDRLATATGLGHWLLHVPPTRKAHPDVGIQALYDPTDPEAFNEARRFAFALLMPEAAFKSLWYEGGGQLTAETLNVPTQSVYDRAKTLELSN
ncbi:ImmA/IrrE family metallo-endopeptidase [uncultured Pelagimonas sp.]|uniref:ImmA/IrrE family metallo-endopeptidase n=1 Tax=uncultured Pelagimonas sp. TaxID=1618102 RepID=UPI002603D4B3|nr:ImmA/IrrE family metallo-endopeptidase [uncultured Pelagimonas sp.]